MKNTDLKKNEIEKNLSENYLEVGWIDSLKFISLITDIEKKFKIQFTNDSFQDRSFSTLGGLSKIIERITNGKV